MVLMRDFLSKCKRVFRVSRKPDKDEYMEITKVTGIGILLIGVVGFVIMLIARYLVVG
jgi:protein transport protein SEC61 subunit gamma-like protein